VCDDGPVTVSRKDLEPALLSDEHTRRNNIPDGAVRNRCSNRFVVRRSHGTSKTKWPAQCARAARENLILIGEVMKKLITMCAVVGMILVVSGVANATINVDIYGSPAPNGHATASSFDAWWSNAQYAIYNSLTTYGTGNAQYNQISATGGQSDIRPAYEAIASGFDSWHGVAGGTDEWGTRMHFNYHIQATGGETLSLSNVSYIEVFEDGWGDTDVPVYETYYDGAGSFDASTTFDIDRLIGYAIDGTLVTSGTAEEWNAANASNVITDIIGTYGEAFAVYFPDNIYYGGTTAQEELDLGIAYIYDNLDSWTPTLTYDGTTVSTTVNFVPEPATMCLLGLGGLLIRRKRRA